MLHIGVLIVPPIQLMDLSPAELFSMMTKAYFEANKISPDLVNATLPNDDVKISYIAYSGPDSVAGTISSLNIAITDGIGSPDVSAGTLDVLFIPGTDLSLKPHEDVLEFVREHVEHGAHLLAICTGIFVAAHSGVLNGKQATGPRSMFDVLQNTFSLVKWQEKRYINDGNIWTTGQITNGTDMVAVYISSRWPGKLSETIIKMGDIDIRPPEYKSP